MFYTISFILPRGSVIAHVKAALQAPEGANISNPRLSEAKPGGRNPLQDNDLVEVEPTLLLNRAKQYKYPDFSIIHYQGDQPC